MGGTFIQRFLSLKSGQDIAITLILVAIVSLMVIPVPTNVVDALIGCNFAIALLLLMTGIYLQRPLDLSTLPSIILISTIFRLALSITTTRLILSTGDAGRIVETFGSFVVAGNVVVGLVVFLIITVVHFIVIAKGSERVAEVAARFTLDALPGKQISIDAELRAGGISQEEAHERRSRLETESQFYGAMDGAMKFVKGDAIAGIIIILVNLVGGLLVGMLQLGLPLGEALQRYSLLTVGDALISQIPALLLAISASTIVTRVNDSAAENLGRDMFLQMSSDYRALASASVLMGGMAVLPGFPAPQLLLLGAAFGVAAFFRYQRALRIETDRIKLEADREDESHADGQSLLPKSEIVRLAFRVPDWILANPELKALCASNLDDTRKLFMSESGIGCPKADLAASGSDKGLVYLDGVAIHECDLVAEHVELTGNYKDNLSLVQPELSFREEGGRHWVRMEDCEKLERAGIGYLTTDEILGKCLLEALRYEASALLGIQETKDLLENIEKQYPELLRELLGKLDTPKVADIFRRLLDDGISLANLRTIIEAVTQWIDKETDPALLAEYIRKSLSRQICQKYALEGKLIPVYMTGKNLEDAIRAGGKTTQVGDYLMLPDKQVDEILGKARCILARSDAEDGETLPCIVTAIDTRRHLQALLRRNRIGISVLSFQDLDDSFVIQTVGSVDIEQAAASAVDEGGRTAAVSPPDSTKARKQVDGKEAA